MVTGVSNVNIKSEPEIKGKKFHIPPITLVIISAIILVVSLFVMIYTANVSKEGDEFRSKAHTAQARIMSKTVYTLNNDEDDGFTVHYLMNITFNTEEDGSGDQYNIQLDETSSVFDTLEPDDTMTVLFDPNDPSDCRPETKYRNNNILYIILVVISIGSIVVAAINLETIRRNIHGYTPKYTCPDDIGTLGEAGAQNGLGDSSIDYSASDVYSNNLMDSYSDPFATYSGYDEEQPEQTAGQYYDPNANAQNMGYDPGEERINNDDTDLNDPFAIYGTGGYGDPKNTD